MKKRIISGLLTLCIIFSMVALIVPASEISVSAATQNQLNMVARANYMYNATWVCKKTVSGWGGTFYAGSTYRVPYGQPIYSGKYIGFNGNAIDDSTIDTYLAAAADPNSIFYTGRSYFTGTQAPYYSNDCSAYVSWCWGVSRKTTASIPGVSTNLGMATASNNYNLQLGDALNSNGVGHVVLVTGLSYDASGRITTIEITEQTPPQLKRSYYTPQSLGAKYGGNYSIQRYYGNVPAAPRSQPIGTSPIGSYDSAEGSLGAVTVAGWAVDPDEKGKSLDIIVNIGGPINTAGTESIKIKSDVLREDVNKIYKCSGNHGFRKTVGTKLTGEQKVYLYACDNNGNAENTCLGNKTVYITPDTEPPVLGEVVIASSDSTKYTVACAVTDNGFISKVLFPTWTEAEPDKKIWYEGFMYNGVAYCDIPIADFNNYQGKYYTHCYAHDSAGNSTGNGNFETTFHLPTGMVDKLTEEDGVLTIKGWAFDKDAADEPISVHVYVGEPGSAYYEGHNITADVERTDVNKIYNCGDYHGFATTVKTSMSGKQPVYIFAINKGNGANVLIDKREITISSEGEPPSITDTRVESSDSKSFTVACDVVDNRRVQSVKMAVWPDNKQDQLKWYDASVSGNVAKLTIPIADFGNYNGKYVIHIYAYDFENNSMGYPFETTFNQPACALDDVWESDGTIHIRGWALDKDAIDEPLEIHAYVGDPTGVHDKHEGIIADLIREDVGKAFSCDPYHGFDAEFKTFMTGTQDIYVYAINKGNGENVLIGKKTVTISEDTTAPVINGADVVSSDAESFTVACDVSDNRGVGEVKMFVWPDDNQDAGIWYTAEAVDGQITATIPIADFDNHNGKYSIHIYAKDWQGNQTDFEYETTYNMPSASFDLVEDMQGAIRVKGWALDADDLNETIYVDVYIGGESGDENAEHHRIKADSVRSDADEFFDLEVNHGFDTELKTSKRGEQEVYVYAVNIGNGDDVFVGSKTVTISDAPVEDVLYGDADRNGTITIADVTRVQQIVANIVEFTEDDVIADVDGNGKLDIRDATMIQRYLAKYIDKFPVEE